MTYSSIKIANKINKIAGCNNSSPLVTMRKGTKNTKSMSASNKTSTSAKIDAERENSLKNSANIKIQNMMLITQSPYLVMQYV
jgi:hypothetical protein